jgi:hypothetical protein
VYDFLGKGSKLSPYTSLSLESYQSNDISLAVHPSTSIIAVGLSVPQPSSAAKDIVYLDMYDDDLYCASAYVCIVSIVPRLAVRINSSSSHQYTQVRSLEAKILIFRRCLCKVMLLDHYAIQRLWQTLDCWIQ